MHSTLLAKRHLSQIMCFCLLANLISARSVQWFEINWPLIINYQLFHQSPTNRDRLLLSVIARQLFIKGFHHRWGRENHWYCPALILLYPLLEHVPGLFLRPGAFENSTAQWVVDSSSFFWTTGNQNLYASVRCWPKPTSARVISTYVFMLRWFGLSRLIHKFWTIPIDLRLFDRRVLVSIHL